jgi:sugar phosphate isomerase/epimerase
MELSMPDLLSYGEISAGRELREKEDIELVLETAGRVKTLAKELGLEIMMLQPFANFEGWPKGSELRRDAFERAERWMSIMEATGTDMLQVCLQSLPSHDID